MPNVLPWIWFFRLGQLITAAIFTFVVLGLTADIVNKVDPSGFGTPIYAGWTLAISALSLLAIIPALLIPRHELFFFVKVEIAWCGALTIFWLVAAAVITSFLNRASCVSTISDTSGTILQPHSRRVRTCHEIQVVMVLSWVNFLNLGTVLIIAVNRAHHSGRDNVGLGAVVETLASVNNVEESNNSAVQCRGDSVPQVQASASYPSNHGYDTEAPQLQI